MWRQLGKLLFLGLLVVAGALGLWRYERYRSMQYEIEKRDEEIRRLEAQKKQLQDFVARLGEEKRVAEVVVTEQTPGSSGIEATTLLFVEYDREGAALPAKFYTIKGSKAHIDALVIKFDRSFLFENDPLRGHSIGLFYRLFGDYQMPAEAFYINQPGQVPDVYRGAGKETAEQFEKELWANFWRLADEPEYRKEKGVRVANPESVWQDFAADKIYTITLEASGGLNLTSKPIGGIWEAYRQAMKQKK